MKAVWALLPLIRHQRGSVVLMGVLHALSAVLNLFTFLSVVPFLRILFGASAPMEVEGQKGSLRLSAMRLTPSSKPTALPTPSAHCACPWWDLRC